MISELFSPQGRTTRVNFFFCMLFAAIGEGFLAVGSSDLRFRLHLARADYYLVLGCVITPFAWVQICAILKRLRDLGWTGLLALLVVPACFWPLWQPFFGRSASSTALLFLLLITVILSVATSNVATSTVATRVPVRPAPPPTAGFDPVVGWLVAIEGQSKGSQYRLRAQRNRIGADPSMEVSLATPGVERAEHATITYDPRNNRYSVAPGAGPVQVGRGSILQPLLQPGPLQPYDRIRLGDTTLIFVPLCGPHYQWPPALPSS
jgi:uncharacterized membrane protein YhaH (DUF805 family)